MRALQNPVRRAYISAMKKVIFSYRGLSRVLALVFVGGTAATMFLPGGSLFGAVSYAGGTYSQDFNTLASTTGADIAWANDSTISGWSLFRQPSSGTAITTYDAGTGSLATGSFYSFGANESLDRAFGGVGVGTAYFGSPASGAVAGWIALSLVNSSGVSISGICVQFRGEQWRNSGNASAQAMVLEYGFGANFSDVPTWTPPGGTFDWTSPVTGTPAGAVDGNVAGLVANRGGSIGGINWLADQTLWLRWVEVNDAGNDHGLAIDDFSLTAVPEPAEWGLFSAIGLLGIAGVHSWQQSRRGRPASAVDL